MRKEAVDAVLQNTNQQQMPCIMKQKIEKGNEYNEWIFCLLIFDSEKWGRRGKILAYVDDVSNNN